MTAAVTGTAYTGREAFSRYVIVTNASQITVTSLSDQPLSGTSGLNSTGLYVDGVAQGNGSQQGSQGTQTSTTYTLPGGSHTVEIVDGFCSEAAAGSPPIRYTPVLSFAVPNGSSVSVVTPAAPSKRIVILGDSVTQGLFPSAGPNQASVYQAWTQLMRANAGASSTGTFAGAHVTNGGSGGRQWVDEAGSPTLISGSITRLTSQLDGTLANLVVAALGVNDYFQGVAASTLKSNLGDWTDALHAAFPAAKIALISPLKTQTESTPNAGGSTPPDIRTAISDVAAARSSYVTYITGLTLVSDVNRASDHVHLTTAGMSEYETNVRAALNAASIGY